MLRRAGSTVVLGLVVSLGLVGPAQAQSPAPPEPVLSFRLQQQGPPSERPPDDPGQAPGPGLFYVPGEFVPDGDTVTWRKGFWARQQPGWTWVPAQWVRLSDGWAFRDGRWVRTPQDAARARNGQDQAGDGQAQNVQVTATVAPTVAVPRYVPVSLYTPVYGYGYPGWGWGGWGWGYPGWGWGWGGWGLGGFGWGGFGWGGFGWAGLGGFGLGFGPGFWW